MTYVGNGPESHRIIPPTIRTQNIESMELQAAELEAEAAESEARLQKFNVSNVQLAQAMQSPGSESVLMERRYAAVEWAKLNDARRGCAKFLKSMASVQRGVDHRQAEIDREGHEKLSTVKTFVEREAIVAEHFGWAESHANSAMAEIATMTARWESTHHAELLRIHAKYQAPRPDPVTPPHNTSPGIVKPLDERHSGKQHQKDDRAGDADREAPRSGVNDQPRTNSTQNNAKEKSGDNPWDARVSGEVGAPTKGLPNPQAPSRAAAPSPLSGGMSGAGMPSGGGSSGGGLGSGLGSNPLSSLGGGLGQSPAGALGSGGLSSTNPTASAASNPGSAFARGFSSASSVVPPPVASPPPAAGTGSTAPVAGPASVPPVTGAASGSGPVAAAGAHGMVTPATAAGTAAGPTSSLPLLPSPGMGAPAAAGATAAVAPVGSAAPAAGAGGGSSTGATAAAAGNVGPTLVPAAVVSAVDPERAVRGLSPDAKAAALLAWRLWHDCREVGWPVNWVVGVFRSSEGAETVVHSTEGSGYVPANVHVPRGVRLLVADDLVDTDFRKKWFGWADPVEVLAEYASMRQGQGWQLVASAVVGVAGNRQALDRQVEFVACSIDDSPYKQGDPVAELDQLHVHRLQLEYPDLYDRLERLSANADQAVVDQLIRPLTQHLVDVALGIAVERFESTDFRDALRDQWRQVRNATPDQPALTPEQLAEMWDPFTQLVITTFRSGVLLQPGKYPGLKPEEDQESAQEYRKAWLVARALEAVAGWAGWPQYRISLPGIVYAAAAVDPESDFREKLNPSLHAAEAAMGW